MSERIYSATVVESNKELTAKQRIMLKDISAARNINDILKEVPELILDIDLIAAIDVHNEQAKDNEDYTVYSMIDVEGERYQTSSESFYQQYMDIFNEMQGSEESWQIKVYKQQSANDATKSFITCTIV